MVGELIGCHFKHLKGEVPSYQTCILSSSASSRHVLKLGIQRYAVPFNIQDQPCIMGRNYKWNEAKLVIFNIDTMNGNDKSSKMNKKNDAVAGYKMRIRELDTLIYGCKSKWTVQCIYPYRTMSPLLLQQPTILMVEQRHFFVELQH
ncbi:unnamed protein product [Mucor circinelloides]